MLDDLPFIVLRTNETVTFTDSTEGQLDLIAGYVIAVGWEFIGDQDHDTATTSEDYARMMTEFKVAGREPYILLTGRGLHAVARANNSLRVASANVPLDSEYVDQAAAASVQLNMSGFIECFSDPTENLTVSFSFWAEASYAETAGNTAITGLYRATEILGPADAGIRIYWRDTGDAHLALTSTATASGSVPEVGGGNLAWVIVDNRTEIDDTAPQIYQDSGTCTIFDGADTVAEFYGTTGASALGWLTGNSGGPASIATGVPLGEVISTSALRYRWVNDADDNTDLTMVFAYTRSLAIEAGAT